MIKITMIVTLVVFIFINDLRKVSNIARLILRYHKLKCCKCSKPRNSSIIKVVVDLLYVLPELTINIVLIFLLCKSLWL